MAAAPAQKMPVPDIAAQVTHAMRVMGIAPIPRNYELYYEAYIGSNPKLTKELAALGSKATQEELDEIGMRYFAHIHRPATLETAHRNLSAQLTEILNMLRDEQHALENYNQILGEAYRNINGKSATGVELLRHAINILADATNATMTEGKERVENVVQKSFEIESIRQELDEYKRIANTDSLTRLANRRAFDERLTGVYNSEKSRHTTGLLVADIDHFKKVNDAYGHPVGDKILATVGNLIRLTVPREAFVARTGGEEFAVIVSDLSPEECQAVAERVRAAVAATPFKNSKTGINYGPITLSIGICMVSEADDPTDLYQKSDLALYCAKNGGRNRVVHYEDGMRKDSGKSWLIYRR
ncbi:GGDEF domain-containing protein [Rhizobium sp. SG2393]|uniref:GGDEF domain-containing protein n=1 Tax=Rhizobium sp. SG2393 TaxID=3276279 RepID=UPI00366ABBF7